jgi:hypothetical protein
MLAPLRAGVAAGLLLAWTPALAHEPAPPAGPGRTDVSGLAPGRPDGHAPLGVMGDHRHASGEWMLSYRFARMGTCSAPCGHPRTASP